MKANRGYFLVVMSRLTSCSALFSCSVACESFLDQGSDPCPELAGRFLSTTGSPGKFPRTGGLFHRKRRVKIGKYFVSLLDSFTKCLLSTYYMHACSVVLTLCDPVNRSPVGFSVHGILQVRILEWVDFSSFTPPPPGDRTYISCISLR